MDNPHPELETKTNPQSELEPTPKTKTEPEPELETKMEPQPEPKASPKVWYQGLTNTFKPITKHMYANSKGIVLYVEKDDAVTTILKDNIQSLYVTSDHKVMGSTKRPYNKQGWMDFYVQMTKREYANETLCKLSSILLMS